MPAKFAQHLVIASILSLSAAAASAQFVWTDEKGVKQYSDRPPPASVPANRILKSPGVNLQPAPAAAPASSSESEGGAPPAAKSGQQSLAERNADFQRRRAEAAEKEKETAEKAKQDAARKKACEQNAQYRAALESGQRISRMSESGERAYLSDEERAAAIREASRVQQQECK